MKDFTGAKRSFIHYAEAWYAQPEQVLIKYHGYSDRVTILLNTEQNSAEMTMRWLSHGPRLEVFSDAWAALVQQMTDVITLLGSLSSDVTPERFCKLLTVMGFVDETPRTDPDEEVAPGDPD